MTHRCQEALFGLHRRLCQFTRLNQGALGLLALGDISAEDRHELQIACLIEDWAVGINELILPQRHLVGKCLSTQRSVYRAHQRRRVLLVVVGRHALIALRVQP